MNENIECCDICAEAAKYWSGGLERQVIDGVKPWRPKTAWKGTSKKKVDVDHPRPIFCMTAGPVPPGGSAKPHPRKDRSLKAEMVA